MARRAKSTKSSGGSGFNPHMTAGNFKKHRALYHSIATEMDVEPEEDEIEACQAALEIFTREAGIPLDVDSPHFNATFDFVELQPGELSEKEVEIVNAANDAAIACLKRCGIPYGVGNGNYEDMVSKWKLKTGQARPKSENRQRKSDQSERIDRLESGMGEILSLLKKKLYMRLTRKNTEELEEKI